MSADERSIPAVRAMSAERLEELRSFNESVSDWYAKCQECGKDLKGTRAELIAHRCEK